MYANLSIQIYLLKNKFYSIHKSYYYFHLTILNPTVFEITDYSQ